MRFTLAAALVLGACSLAAAQGAPSIEKQQTADPAASAEADKAYMGRCEAKAPKALCGCVVAVANIHINDIAEKQVLYDYMMGDVEKAKAQRAIFTPEKARVFNTALQKVDTMLGEQCDKLKPAAPAAAPAPDAPKAN